MDYSKSYQRIFDEIFWRGVIYSLEEVNSWTTPQSLKLSRLWMFQIKIIVYYQSTAH